VVGIVVGIVVLGAAGVGTWLSMREPVAPTTPSPREVEAAALARVRELEERLAALEGVTDLSEEGVVAPVLAEAPDLEYPKQALRQRAQGTVRLRGLIDETGAVVEVELVAGVTGSGLNEAAIENLKRRRYEPATKDGEPVKVWLPVRVVFKLPD
jgi:protein TonB